MARSSKGIATMQNRAAAVAQVAGYSRHSSAGAGSSLPLSRFLIRTADPKLPMGNTGAAHVPECGFRCMSKKRRSKWWSSSCNTCSLLERYLYCAYFPVQTACSTNQLDSRFCASKFDCTIRMMEWPNVSMHSETCLSSVLTKHVQTKLSENPPMLQCIRDKAEEARRTAQYHLLPDL